MLVCVGQAIAQGPLGLWEESPNTGPTAMLERVAGNARRQQWQRCEQKRFHPKGWSIHFLRIVDEPHGDMRMQRLNPYFCARPCPTPLFHSMKMNEEAVSEVPLDPSGNRRDR